MISTAGDAALSVADPSSNPGHLVNGAFSLPQPLQAASERVVGNGPTLELAPDVQRGGDGRRSSSRSTANDALRTGAYSKTLTFTLSTTTP